ncbi:diphthine methyl ester synthase isoform X2 [Ischnura elegans]|uniref:diphthine methyl ester synthase isoform X2 n=1 Tax=Ischnura elegans TaxID=197161 RepID=UPI001ED894B4|nr:diphthine methyl ester synthase isoform X2 [Ischnura elegans]
MNIFVEENRREEFYGRNLIIADREMVEQNSEEILNAADVRNVALLVVGDPFGATTHLDLIIRAKEKKIPFQVVHNASIMNAIGCCGLQLYSFGETVSIPYWTDSWQPDSFYDKIHENRKRGLHTLCLLDIKVKEPTMESLMKRKKEYEPPRFMSVAEAAHQLLQIIDKKSESSNLAYLKETLCIGVARVGSSTQQIVSCSLREMMNVDLGKPLHSLVITGGKLHPLEEEYLNVFSIPCKSDQPIS